MYVLEKTIRGKDSEFEVTHAPARTPAHQFLRLEVLMDEN